MSIRKSKAIPVSRKVYQVRYHMVDIIRGKVISFSSVFTYEYYEDAVDEMLGLGFEPYDTLGSSFSWKRSTDKEGCYTLGTIERVDED